MSQPDLQSPEGRSAYRAELMQVARGWRWTGLAIVVLGAILYVLRAREDQAWSSPMGLATIAALILGWGLVIVGVFKRTRYHKARMAGLPRP